MADDQEIFCEVVRRALAVCPQITFLAVLEPTAFIQAALDFAPTVILMDLVMPEVDGLELVRRARACAALRDVPIVVLSSTEEATVKREAFEAGANDYVVKLPETPELLARVRYHSDSYNHLLQRNAAQSALHQELEEGRRYICSLFPQPLHGRGVRANWAFEASSRLSGDAFTYDWSEDGADFTFGLHDVCGHGVAAALHSVSVLNVLRARSLLGVDFARPASVLGGLNNMFQMDRHDGLFFTIWYGCYQRQSRRLVYACGGHPPAILIDPANPQQALRLDAGGMALGIGEHPDYREGAVTVPPGARLYLFSDGVYEVERRNGSGLLGYEALAAELLRAVQTGTAEVDALAQWVRQQQGSDDFEDDFTLIEIVFE